MTRPSVGLEEHEQLAGGAFPEPGLVLAFDGFHGLEVEPESFGYLESLPGWADGREPHSTTGRRAVALPARPPGKGPPPLAATAFEA